MKSRTILCWFVTTFLATCGKGEAFSQTDFWQKTNPPLGRTVGSVASNAISNIIAGTDSGVFRSTDNGGTWTQSNSGLNPDVGYFVFASRRGAFSKRRSFYSSADSSTTRSTTGTVTSYQALL